MSRHTYECHVRFSDVDVYGHVEQRQVLRVLPGGPDRVHPVAAGRRDDAQSSMRQVVARIDVDYKRPILFRPEPYVVETWVTRDRHLVVRPLLPDRRRGRGHRLVPAPACRWSPSTSATQRSRPLTDRSGPARGGCSRPSARAEASAPRRC